MHLLIIEDDLDLGAGLQQALKANGLSSTWLRRAIDLPEDFDGLSIDCVLLDLSLPDAEGLNLLAAWRSRGMHTPVIVITARFGLDDRLAGLDGGADDFILKPFAMAELISRIHAVLRRYARQASEVWQLGSLEIEPQRFQARLQGETLELSRREFRLLLELAREPGAVLAKSDLAQRMAPLGDPLDAGTIEVHIFNLRRKIGPQRIQTVRGVGYFLDCA
ncbi:response regulator transcription factor [Paucibacter sp. B2R-40]|uniref:response regulator n=1 Tax=Paucibacter sp. B2R-40 TaxID=2893554 RepID=UPI0021E38416|nr:response regulator transcription factor [Paucibacter sp. B2R-40]MCV2354841.1 response regulator transcription factor [Paucibacter sp. B2R-40]